MSNPRLTTSSQSLSGKLDRSKRSILYASCIAGILAYSPAALAQAEPASQGAEEPSANFDELATIVVTARKVDENLTEVPFGISAVTSDDIAASAMSDIDDVQSYTPGLFFNGFGAGRADRGIRNFVIRGINVGAFVNANDAAILFVDGAPVVSGDATSFTEVERVEVLKGPQTAYFGRNTFSGAINVVTKNPSDYWQGRVDATYETPGSTKLSGSIEGPIIPGKIAFRLGGYFDDTKGDYINTADGSRLGDKQTKTVSGTLYVTPTDNLSIKVFGEISNFDDGPGASSIFSADQLTCDANGDGNANWFCGQVPDFPTGLLAQNTTFDSTFTGLVAEPFTIFNGDLFIEKAGLAKRNRSVHGIISYELPSGATIESITAYHKTKTQLAVDLDNRDTKGLPTNNPNRTFLNLFGFIERSFEDFSQELRITSDQSQKIRWTVGGNYVRPNIIAANVAAEFPQAPGVFPITTFPTFTSRTYGAFGGVYVDLSDRFTVSGEARYQIDKVRVAIQPEDLTENFKSFAPRVTIQYRASDDLNLFANWARGFRPGAFNARLLTFPASVAEEIVRQTGADVAIDEESLDQFEVGLKGEALDRRLSFSLVGYWGKITNQQITTSALVDTTGTSGILTQINVVNNAGSTEIKGIEADARLLIPQPFSDDDRLQFTTTFAWTGVNFKEFFCGLCASITGEGDVAGNRYAKSPEFTGSVVGDYSAPLNENLLGFLRAEYLYRGSIYATEANIAETGAQHLINLRAGVEGSNWRLEAFVTNLLQDDTYLSIERQSDLLTAGSPSSVAFALPERRRAGIRASFNF